MLTQEIIAKKRDGLELSEAEIFSMIIGLTDKFDAIPGYNTNPDNATLERVTREVGCAIIGQTADIAPADKRLYSIRDVTGTVESIDLICASILSKKAVKFLRGDEIDTRLWDVTVALGAELLVSAGIADADTSRAKMTDALQSGKAAEVFGKMVSALGGPNDFMETFDTHLDHAPIVREVLPKTTGFVSGVNAKGLGLAVVELGGGRRNSSDEIDYAVGLDWTLGIGLATDPETPLCRIHARTEDQADRAESRIRDAYTITDTPPIEDDLIKERIVR